jgi:RimJ/RimL family protein N-acetyltransferase
MPVLADTPVLHTERLVLRAPRAGDFAAWDAFARSGRARFIGGPFDARDAWRAFANIVGHWVLRGWGEFVFCARGSEAPLGCAGPWFPESWPEREIAWTIWSPEAEGRGYAFEAAQAARAHAFDALGWETAVSYIDPANARSIALAERLGARRDDTAPRLDPADLVYRHPAPGAVAA